jgi:hypothetical protein
LLTPAAVWAVIVASPIDAVGTIVTMNASA